MDIQTDETYQNAIKYFKNAEYANAINCFSTLLLLVRSKNDESVEAHLLQALGNCFLKTREHDKAKQVLNDALEIWKENHDVLRESEILIILGNVFISMRHYDEALESLSKALDICRSAGHLKGVGIALQALGNLYQKLGQYDLAVKVLNESLEISQKHNYGDVEAASAQVLGGVHDLMGEFDSAIDLLRRAVAGFGNLGDDDGLARCYETLGNLYQSLGKYELSLEALSKGLEMNKQRADITGQAICLNGIGNISMMQGQHEKALEPLLQSIGLAEQVNDNEGCAKAHYALGLARTKLNDLENAVESFEAAIAACECIQQNLRSRDEARIAIFEQQRRCYVRLIDCLMSLNREREALLASERGKARALRHLLGHAKGSLSSAASAAAEQAPMDWDCIRKVAIDEGVGVLVFSTLEEDQLGVWLITPAGDLPVCGRLSLGGPKGGQGTLSGELELALCAIGARNRDALARDSGKQGAEDSNVDLPREGHDGQGLRDREIVQTLDLSCEGTDGRYRLVPRTAQGAELLALCRSQPKLHEEALNVLWRHRVMCSWLESLCYADDCPAESDGSRQGLEQAVRAVQTAVSIWSDLRDLTHEVLQGYGVANVGIRQYLLMRIQGLLSEERQLKKLYELLIAPIEEDIEEIPDLLIVPDLMLWVVPWAALTDSANRKLIQRHSIRLSPSISIAREAASSIGGLSSQSPLVVGNPHHASYASLIHAVDEANAVAVQLNVRPLTGFDATKAATREALREAPWAHLACHACLERQSVILSPSNIEDDGLLTAADVTVGPRLSGGSTVVLSACNTGRGAIRGEGVVGLSRAFLVANASAVVVSLWSVQDESTRLLMEAMYAALAQGYSVPQALQFAMIMMIEHGQFSPYFWAGFVVVGACTYLPKTYNVNSWDVEKVCSLFKKCGFRSDIVRSNGVDGKTLLSLTDEQIQSELGLKFLQVKRLRAELESEQKSANGSSGITAAKSHGFDLAKMEQEFSKTNGSWFARISGTASAAVGRNMSPPKSADDFAALAGTCEKELLIRLGFNFVLNGRDVCIGNGLLENGYLTTEALSKCLAIEYPDTYICLWGAEGRIVQFARKMVQSDPAFPLNAIRQYLEDAIEYRRKDLDTKCQIRRSIRLALLKHAKQAIGQQVTESDVSIRDVQDDPSCVQVPFIIKLACGEDGSCRIHTLADADLLLQLSALIQEEIAKISKLKASALLANIGCMQVGLDDIGFGQSDRQGTHCVGTLSLKFVTRGDLFESISSKMRQKTIRHEYVKQQMESCLASLTAL